jgi:hypothetical protein
MRDNVKQRFVMVIIDRGTDLPPMIWKGEFDER